MDQKCQGVDRLETKGIYILYNQKIAQLTNYSSARRLGWYFLQKVTSTTTYLSWLSIFEIQIKPNSLPLRDDVCCHFMHQNVVFNLKKNWERTYRNYGTNGPVFHSCT